MRPGEAVQQHVNIRQILRSAISSPGACALYFGVGFAIPEWLYLANDLQEKGLLTAVNAFLLAITCLLVGAIVGLLGWFSVSNPLRGNDSAV